MVEEKKPIEDLVIKIKLEEDVEQMKYIDIELSYQFTDQNKIESIIKAINSFIETNSEGLVRTNYNVLGNSYNY